MDKDEFEMMKKQVGKIDELIILLDRMRSLVILHHDCSKQVKWGQICPSCHKAAELLNEVVKNVHDWRNLKKGKIEIKEILDGFKFKEENND